MEMRNCPRCKRVFNYTGIPICPVCVKEDETVFEEVRLFIRANPDSPLAAVAEATGCSVKKILRYVKEGRLEISRGMQGEIVCENCGCPILKGKYCDACIIELNIKVDSLFEKKPAAKMHTKNETGKTRMHTDKPRS